MKLDLQRTFQSLKEDFPEKFQHIGEFETLSEKEAQQFLEKNFTINELLRINAELVGVPFVELKVSEIPKDLVGRFPFKTMSRYHFVPFREDQGVVSVAMSDPQDFTAIQAIKFVLREMNMRLELYMASVDDIDKSLKTFEDLESEVRETLEEIEDTKGTQLDVSKELSGTTTENIATAPIIKVVSVILKNAVEGGASDIHLERSEDIVRVRFRVDGVLHTSLLLPKDVYSAVVARIKILSNLKIDEQRKPQDGRFSILDETRKVDFRVSTFPTQYGEKVVLRILDTSQGIRSLEQLGFKGPGVDLIRQAIGQPYGMLLVTGPTGSGKSTTLYTLLSMVNSEEINIVTLEDPIEYYINGVNQSQVKPEINYTFASGLRSILRQDPDIIMVGEIRDGETAGLAVQSALTGHLVFSTLHTNDAPGAIPRLMDMGVEPFLISASVQIIVAQRLVRMLCQKCKQKVEMDESVRSYFKTELQSVPIEHKAMFIEGEPMVYYKPQGCEECSNGFKGRMSIFEAIAMTDELKMIIERDFDEGKFFDYLKNTHYVTMKQDGLLKVLQGFIYLEELLTVVES